MTAEHTELGNEVRADVAAILAKYNGKHEAIAGVKVSTLRKLDAYLNPAPQGFEIPVHRCDARPYLALEQARIDRLLCSETTGAAS